MLFGPVHTFAGQEATHFVTESTCTPIGTLAGDADYFCEAYYGPNCVARTGYVADTATTADWRMHIGGGAALCGDEGTAIPGTWCSNRTCKIGELTEATTGITDLVCDCY
ncbi:MAG: hypothetical protein JRI25_28685 [Deltaproteobacteria bacterium]|nr:hypothetical protein [Deltaproteobacteria bacterium]